MITDKEFMEELARDYPNQNWDEVPDPSTLPSVYTVSGKKQIVTRSLINGKTTKILEHFQINTEFPTKESAEEYIEKMRPTWSKVVFRDESLTWRNKLVWSGPYLFDTIQIQEKKPVDAVMLSTVAEFRKEILSGKTVFPMSLP